VPRRALPGDVGAGEDQLPPAQQEHRPSHQISQGRRGDRGRGRRSDIIKGYEVGKGQYIELDPEEIEAVAIESKRTIEIDQFVPRDEIDEIFFGNPYYLVPDGEVGAQAFAVIREAIKKEGMVAIGKVVFTSREHIIALEPRGKGLMGVTLRYPYEIRKKADYFDDIPDEKIPKDMLDLAGHIVESKAGHFDPKKFEDHYERALTELLRQKQAGKPIERPQEPKRTNVVSLMDALRKSLQTEAGTARKKPAGSSPAQRRTPAKRPARRRKAS
jgi:DNA end-binding protein Ku